jgi:hypothetical protein
MEYRASRATEPYMYGELGSRRMVESWHAGHIRAALLAAAVGRTGQKEEVQFVLVQIPFRTFCVPVARDHLGRINWDLENEGFTSFVFDIATSPDNQGCLTMSLFSREEIRYGGKAPRTAFG